MKFKLPEIFLDKRNRYIYYNHKKEKAFLIPENQFKKYNAFHNRLILAIALGAVIPLAFELDIIFIPIIGIISYLILELTWRTKLLPDLEEIPNYNYEKSHVDLKNKNSKTVDVLKTILYFVAGVLIVYLSFTDPEYETTEVVIMVLFGIFTLILGVSSFMNLLKRND